MFSGTFEVTMDDKFRLSLPTEFKDELVGKKFVLTLSLDSQALQLITQERFDAILNTIRSKNKNLLTKDAIMLERFFLSSKTDVEFDKTLRLIIPRGIRGLLKLTEKCQLTILGIDDRLEIWESSAYQQCFTNNIVNGKLLECLNSFVEA